MSGREQSAGRLQTQAAMAVAALMMAHQVAGKACRDAIFLSHFKTSELPAMVVVAAIGSVAASVVGSRALVRSGPHRMAPVAFALSGVFQFAEWILLAHWPQMAACIIYLHVVAWGAVLMSSFWSLMNESFEPRSAKQLFGRISGVGTLGGVCGGLLAERVAALLGPADVVLALAVLHLACAAALWRVFPSNASAVAPRRDAVGGHKTSAVEAIQRYPFLLTLAGLVIVTSSATALLDFVFKAQATHTIGRGPDLLRFFGIYYTATSLLTFLFQTYLAPVAVKRAGLAFSAGTLPMAISLGSLAGMALPGFAGLSAIRGTEIVMRGSLYRSAYELFYTAVAPAEKRAVKPLIDVGADRMGDAVGSAGVGLMLTLAPRNYGAVLALGAMFAMSALWFAARLRRGYLHALEKSLKDRAIEIDPSMMEDPTTGSVFMRSIEVLPMPFEYDPPAPTAPAPRRPVATDSFLRRAADLRSGDAARAIAAAGELGAQDWELAPLALDLLAWDETMDAAGDALERMGTKIAGMLIDALLDPDRDFAIRRRAPRILAHLPSSRTVDALFAALQDARFEVRFYSGRALYLLIRDHPDLALPPEKIWAAVNRELSRQRPVWNSHRLLDSRTSGEKEWFFDDQLLDRADRNLEHLFTLLALLLPMDAVRIAFRALHTEDRQLKGTAFEYLESATPPHTRELLLPVLEADAESRSRLSADRAMEKLMASQAEVNQTLKLERMEAHSHP